ncbi:TadE/TadG family type IV pilus assembly protein [uncultured Azohydromonas sp.]|jgi:Flp pilus assembly protein TadG|uniref:TadE/TadG family type IV pilus assembly protein n=1 Tax=uncultured Azohydromonas sp. TaxID=487342 RepID=UPI0026313DE6|nr:TadE/TadG family type IV pilus assembly protein [uncultured Azohydromonas sp.]
MTGRPACHAPATRRHRQRGVAIVELALVLLPLVLLLMLTVDLGRAFYTFNTLTKAARGAARHLTLVNPEDPDKRSEARNLVLYGNVNGSGTKLVPDLDSEAIEICTPALCEDHDDEPIDGGTMDLVSVRIHNYAYAPLFSALLPAPLNFKDISVTMRAFP